MEDSKTKHKSSSSKRLDGVQIFRGLAALAVLLYHINLQFTEFVPGTPDFKAAPWPWTIHRLGFLGVDFFFVLSGFIIYYIHRKDLGIPKQGKTFLLKRFFRIQPLLWSIILIKLTYLILANKDSVEWVEVINTALTLPGIKMIGVAWTLTFEWMFYLFFLGCILVSRRWVWILGAIWGLLTVGASYLDQQDWSQWLQVPFSPYVVLFLCGVVAAEAFNRWPDQLRFANFCIAPLVIILLLIGVTFDPFNLTPFQFRQIATDMAYGRYFWGLTFGLLVWWAAVSDAKFRSWVFAPLLIIGNASYAIYLFHNEILQAFIRIGKALDIFQYGNAVFWMWIYAVALLVAGIVIHFMIELPLLNWSRKFISKGTDVTAKKL